ncbi:MAG: hypothetical protein LBR15_03885 [Methanobrevibacter sp.]|jgi:hypothetical protein|nr:hypothetical protein [Candidatus Methanovirga australis]
MILLNGTVCEEIMQHLDMGIFDSSTYSIIFNLMVLYMPLNPPVDGLFFVPCPGPLPGIIGSILLAIGLGMFGLAVWFIVYSEVTMKNLQNRLIDVRNNIQTI